MLSVYHTKYGAGIKLFGDYRDLQSLHKTVHYLAYDGSAGAECLAWLEMGGWFTKDYLFEFICHKAKQYACELPPGKKRFKILPDLLRQLHPLSPEYKAFAERLGKLAKEKICSMAELQDLSDWPDFKW